MLKLDAKARGFVERVGAIGRSLNAPPAAGRLLALLLLSEKPVSLDEACRLLGASKGPLSTHARSLLAVGLVHRVKYPRDRRDYYEVAPGTFERQLSLRAADLRAWREVAASGLEVVETGDGLARARLEEMRQLCSFLAEQMEATLETWRARRRRSAADLRR